MAKKYVKISRAEIEKIHKILSRADYVTEKFIICNEARDVLLQLIADASNTLWNAHKGK